MSTAQRRSNTPWLYPACEHTSAIRHHQPENRVPRQVLTQTEVSVVFGIDVSSTMPPDKQVQE